MATWAYSSPGPYEYGPPYGTPPTAPRGGYRTKGYPAYSPAPMPLATYHSPAGAFSPARSLGFSEAPAISPEIPAGMLRGLNPGAYPTPRSRRDPAYWTGYVFDTYDVDPQILDEPESEDEPEPEPEPAPAPKPQPKKAQRSAPPKQVQRAVAPPPEKQAPPPVRQDPPSPPKSLQKVGVGLQLETNLAGDCIVTYVVPDFAAERSGLFNVDDLVLSINGTDLSGMPLADIKKLTIGTEGTVCTLVCKRARGDTYVAHLIRRVPTMVDASNAECTQSVFKFMSADTDGDGFVSLDELRATMPTWSDQQVRSYFSKLDRNGDGKVSKEEYEDYWQKHTG